MSREDVEIVRRGFDAWARGGVEPLLELLDPAIKWHVRADLPDAGTYRGHARVRQLFARFEEVLEDMGVDPQEYIDTGDRVVVPVHWWGRGKLSGVEIGERHGETWVFTVRDGAVVEIQEYADKQQALAAVPETPSREEA